MKRHIALSISVFIMIGFVCIVLSAQTPDLAKLFPDIAGWQKKGAAETYSPENLYQYIDGAAENFLSYDFKQLAVQNYANDQGQALSAEIYFHGTTENAFGIYSSEKPTIGNYFAIGSQGYAEEGVLNYFCDAYYVKLNSFDLGPKSKVILTSLAEKIVRAIDGKNVLPEILDAFPDRGKIPNSERYILRNFLGHDFLRSAFVADYELRNQKFQLFIIRAGDENEARVMLEKYAALAKEKAQHNIQPGGLTINDPYNGPIQIFWRGKFICGSSGQNDSSAEYLSTLSNLLPK